MDLVDLATLDGLAHAVREQQTVESSRERDFGEWDGTFCSECGDPRRMKLIALTWRDRWVEGAAVGLPAAYTPPAAQDPGPALFVAQCLQCHSILTLVVHPGPSGIELIALPQSYGGLATPSTPPGVAYYLDQAQRCVSVGALSASVAMYRSALEHLLHDQGYTEGMVGKRIQQLMNDEKPPEWKEKLSEDYLKVINELGNGAIHSNDGDVNQQMIFEAGLIREVRELFIELLDEVYEIPQRKADRLARLKNAAASIKR